MEKCRLDVPWRGKARTEDVARVIEDWRSRLLGSASILVGWVKAGPY